MMLDMAGAILIAAAVIGIFIGGVKLVAASEYWETARWGYLLMLVAILLAVGIVFRAYLIPLAALALLQLK